MRRSFCGGELNGVQVRVGAEGPVNAGPGRGEESRAPPPRRRRRPGPRRARRPRPGRPDHAPARRRAGRPAQRALPPLPEQAGAAGRGRRRDPRPRAARPLPEGALGRAGPRRLPRAARRLPGLTGRRRGGRDRARLRAGRRRAVRRAGGRAGRRRVPRRAGRRRRPGRCSTSSSATRSDEQTHRQAGSAGAIDADPPRDLGRLRDRGRPGAAASGHGIRAAPGARWRMAADCQRRQRDVDVGAVQLGEQHGARQVELRTPQPGGRQVDPVEARRRAGRRRRGRCRAGWRRRAGSRAAPTPTGRRATGRPRAGRAPVRSSFDRLPPRMVTPLHWPPATRDRPQRALGEHRPRQLAALERRVEEVGADELAGDERRGAVDRGVEPAAGEGAPSNIAPDVVASDEVDVGERAVGEPGGAELLGVPVLAAELAADRGLRHRRAAAAPVAPSSRVRNWFSTR